MMPGRKAGGTQEASVTSLCKGWQEDGLFLAKVSEALETVFLDCVSNSD